MNDIHTFLENFVSNVVDGFESRWESYTPEVYDNEVSEVLGGLAARQATLAVEMARNPGIWNPHVAPLLLRCMVETHITTAWVAEEPLVRARSYIQYGLGQEKLIIEHLSSERTETDDVAMIKDVLEFKRAWLATQVAEWAIEINVGSWSGKSARDMAREASCESLYKFAYVPFSGAVHSMWNHVGLFNMTTCTNPLHKYHRVPVMPELAPHPDYLFRAAKYVSRTYEVLDKKLGLQSDVPLPMDYFTENQPSHVDESADA